MIKISNIEVAKPQAEPPYSGIRLPLCFGINGFVPRDVVLDINIRCSTMAGDNELYLYGLLSNMIYGCLYLHEKDSIKLMYIGKSNYLESMDKYGFTDSFDYAKQVVSFDEVAEFIHTTLAPKVVSNQMCLLILDSISFDKSPQCREALMRLDQIMCNYRDNFRVLIVDNRPVKCMEQTLDLKEIITDEWLFVDSVSKTISCATRESELMTYKVAPLTDAELSSMAYQDAHAVFEEKRVNRGIQGDYVSIPIDVVDRLDANKVNYKNAKNVMRFLDIFVKGDDTYTFSLEYFSSLITPATGGCEILDYVKAVSN